MGGAIFGILAMLGLAVVAAVAARSSEPTTPKLPPAPPPPPPPPPPVPQLPKIPRDFPSPWPNESPTIPVSQPAANSATTIAPDGTKVFRQEVLPQLIPVLDAYGVEPVEGDPTKVKLVARTQPNQVSAAQWVAGYGKFAIAAVEWLPFSHEPKFLRAIRPEEAKTTAPPTGFYAILTGPTIIAAQWPQQWPQQVPPMPIPEQPTGLEELPPEVRTKVASLLAGSNADAMETAANEIEKQGYARSAEILRKRAADVRLASSVSNTAAGRTYTVNGKELPSQVAQWYTGDANRWRELVQTNSELRIRKVGEVEYLTPWKSGMTIVLPSTWNTKKGPMPIQSQSIARVPNSTQALEAFPAGLSQTAPPK